LVERCLRGDDHAWAILLDRYGSLIYTLARKFSLPSEDVADVFQSVCLSLLKNLDRLQSESKLSSWLTTATLQQCRQLVDLDSSEEELIRLPDDLMVPDETIQRLEQERLMRQAISVLDESCRRLLTCLLYEDEVWFSDEFARETDWSVSVTEPNLGCCLKRLSEILDQLGF